MKWSCVSVGVGVGFRGSSGGGCGNNNLYRSINKSRVIENVMSVLFCLFTLVFLSLSGKKIYKKKEIYMNQNNYSINFFPISYHKSLICLPWQSWVSFFFFFFFIFFFFFFFNFVLSTPLII